MIKHIAFALLMCFVISCSSNNELTRDKTQKLLKEYFEKANSKDSITIENEVKRRCTRGFSLEQLPKEFDLIKDEPLVATPRIEVTGMYSASHQEHPAAKTVEFNFYKEAKVENVRHTYY